jgi:hypothetical protein
VFLKHDASANPLGLMFARGENLRADRDREFLPDVQVDAESGTSETGAHAAITDVTRRRNFLRGIQPVCVEFGKCRGGELKTSLYSGESPKKSYMQLLCKHPNKAWVDVSN